MGLAFQLFSGDFEVFRGVIQTFKWDSVVFGITLPEKLTSDV